MEEREGGLLTRERRRVAGLRRKWTRSRTDLDHSGGGGGGALGVGMLALTLFCQL